jgi:orotidine-5'-phosphate decarboxylase
VGLSARDRLIVALDVATVDAAEALVDRLGDSITFYKVGYQLVFAGGLSFAKDLAQSGKQLFLDMKLHDIGNTVARGVENVVRTGATFLTVHAYPQTMRAAVEASAGSGLRILGVTVLTSFDDADLAEAGYDRSVEHLVAQRARQAQEIGLHGVVCSPSEASALRLLIGPDMLLVTPGIRLPGLSTNDQKRITSPAQAIRASADYLVVGRPIIEAPDPRAAAEAIVRQIDGAAGEKS